MTLSGKFLRLMPQIGMAGDRLIKRKWFDAETDTSLKSRKQWKSNNHETRNWL